MVYNSTQKHSLLHMVQSRTLRWLYCNLINLALHFIFHNVKRSQGVKFNNYLMLLSSDRKTATSVALTVAIFNCKKIAALNTNGHLKPWK